MEFIAKKTQLSAHKSSAAVVFCHGKKLLPSAKLSDSNQLEIIQHIALDKTANPSFGSSTWLTLKPSKGDKFEKILLVNIEHKSTTQKALDKPELIHLANSIAKKLDASQLGSAAIYFDSFFNTIKTDQTAEEIANEFALALYRTSYRFNLPSVKKPKVSKLKKICLVATTSAELKHFKQGLSKGSAFGLGINIARHLGDLPGNICTPDYLAQESKKLTKRSSNVTVKILNEKQMDRLGMHSFLSVSKGSCEEGKLICIEYKGKTSSSPNVIVGKGITFDTGGISLKPGNAMDEMKYDMCGAASVIGTMNALIHMQAKVHVVAVIAAAENMPNENASKPGDIVTSMSGQTIEILNTDAEGRLVLCDALTYVERYKPKSVIDIATLTGACVVALGKHASALYSNNDKLSKKLLESSALTHDRVWQMPLWDDYQNQLNSNFADMANIGGPGGGSITAACFLSRFTKKYPWAHLDIAGTAWLNGAQKGSTGRPVSLLTHYLLNN